MATDPATAFHAFTEEMDLWWVRGPINFWSDAASGGGGAVRARCRRADRRGPRSTRRRRARASDASRRGSRRRGSAGTARPTTSSPRCRSRRRRRGTLVQVLHTIPAGGDDRGGTAWSRVVPQWFGDWVLRRDTCPTRWSMSPGCHSVSTTRSRSPPPRFLAEAFGFGPVTTCPRPSTTPTSGYGYHWIEFRSGLVGAERVPDRRDHAGVADAPARGSTSTTSTRTTPRPRQSGATIIEEPHPFPGERRVRRGRSGGQPLALLPGAPHPALAIRAASISGRAIWGRDRMPWTRPTPSPKPSPSSPRRATSTTTGSARRGSSPRSRRSPRDGHRRGRPHLPLRGAERPRRRGDRARRAAAPEWNSKGVIVAAYGPDADPEEAELLSP